MSGHVYHDLPLGNSTRMVLDCFLGAFFFFLVLDRGLAIGVDFLGVCGPRGVWSLGQGVGYTQRAS